MSRTDAARVLAIGIDAAEPALVRRLIDASDLPCLADLLRSGAWGTVESPAHIGSGAVWPSFMTGTSPFEHGVFGEWSWRADEMRLVRTRCDHLVPFWRDAAARGTRVAVLDVPFAPIVELPAATVVHGWGAHDSLGGRTEVWPPELQSRLAASGAHPFAAETVDSSAPDDFAGLERVVSRCVEGVRKRGALAARIQAERAPDLFLLVFTEVHRASHLLWHGVDPCHPLYEVVSRRAPARVRGGLVEILREVDRQIGELVRAAGRETSVVVFSLHGMRPASGIAAVLGPLLAARGLTASRGFLAQSWRERRETALAAVKRALPPGVKRLYYRSISLATAIRLAGPSMAVPAFDWPSTVAFALPTDQHGWIRVSLAGREARGRVLPREYDATCEALRRMLEGLTTADGRPVVKRVLRLDAENHGAPPAALPDLVVHWDAAATDWPLRLREPPLEVSPIGVKFTGQHAPDGFFVHRPANPGGGPVPERVKAGDLHRLLLSGPVGSPAAGPPAAAPDFNR